jgi:hypothetical protein
LTEREAEMLDALILAREYIADNIMQLLQSFTVPDGEKKPNRETLDPAEAAVVATDEKVLATIDAVIAKAKGAS